MADQTWFDRQKAEMEAIERARAIIQRHASYTSHNNPELAWAADTILRYFDAGRAVVEAKPSIDDEARILAVLEPLTKETMRQMLFDIIWAEHCRGKLPADVS